MYDILLLWRKGLGKPEVIRNFDIIYVRYIYYNNGVKCASEHDETIGFIQLILVLIMLDIQKQ